MKKAPWNWTAGLATAMPVVLGIGLLAGCEQLEAETARADRRVEARLLEAGEPRPVEAGEPAEARIALLRQAAAETAASPDRLAHARSLLGQAQLDSAQHILREIERDELEAARLMWQIDRLVSHVAIGNAAVESYQLAEPARVKEQIAARVAEARGGADQRTWQPVEGVQLPTLSALRQRISELDGEIVQRQDQIRQAQSQRGELIQQADQADRRSRDLRGQESVALYTQASNLRKQAADLLIRIQTLEAELIPLDMERSMARDQQAAVEQAIAALQERSGQLDQKWEQVQRQVQAQQTLARTIAGGQANQQDQASIASKSAQLQEIVTRLEEQRASARELMEEAISNFQAARTASDQADRGAAQRLNDLRNTQRSDYRAYEHQRLASNPLVFDFRQADAMHLLATLHAGLATHLNGRLELARGAAPVLRAANLQVPPVLEEGDLQRQLTDAWQIAGQAYEAAADRFETVREGPLAARVPQLREQVRVSLALALHGWSQLAAEQGDEQQAAARLQRAQAELRAVNEEPQARALIPTALPPQLQAAMTRGPTRQEQPRDNDEEPAS